MPDSLPTVSTIYLGGFHQFTRNPLNSGNIYDHHITGKLPGHQYNQTPKGGLSGGQPAHQAVPACIFSYSSENTDKNELPYKTQYDSTNEIRHEKNSSENIT